MVNDTALERFDRYHARGPRPSVILPHTMIADAKDDLIGCLAAKLLSTRDGWSPTKERMRHRLERPVCMHGYRDYQLTRVGQSFQYDIPLSKRNILGQFNGKCVRLVCV